MPLPYRHEPFTDFTDPNEAAAFDRALEEVESRWGGNYDLIIGGERIATDKKWMSVNPAQTDQVLGRVSQADRDLAERAMQTAQETYQTWRRWDPKSRADILFKTAAILRRRKHEFSAMMVMEAGKPREQADPDTAEAIDFLEYYARQMIRIADGGPVNDRPNEHNALFYKPMGVGVVIPPWNFPLAIMCGTTVSAVVTGNTVLLKPSENTPVIAAEFVRVLEEAGLPNGVVNFIPGDGPEVGGYLVEHPQTRFINFTGSRKVGSHIFERAARVHEGQTWLKRVVAEMGGKDTIVVDEDADLDLAARSIVQSTFGFAGQKCSACSRAVVHKAVYDEVLKRTVALTKQLTVDDTRNHPEVGPVIDRRAYDKIMDYIDIGKQEGKLECGGTGKDTPGYFIQPTVFSGLEPKARIMQEEIFGPVVAFTSAKDFDQALDIANNTDYGLTGSVITNNRQHIDQAKRDFDVGNLYINRGCTGSIVGYQPFGGFKMSGTDAKAGGPDYLLNFLEAKTSTESL